MALALGTDNHYSAVSFDNFALIAHRFYRRSNFHDIFSLLIKSISSRLRLASPRDSAFRQIVRAHFQFYRIPFDDTNIVHTKFTGNIRRDDVTVGKLYTERRVGQRFHYLSFRFDYVVFGHRIFLRFFSSQQRDLRAAISLQREYLYAVLAHHQRIFVMRSAFAVYRHRRPIVVE